MAVFLLILKQRPFHISASSVCAVGFSPLLYRGPFLPHLRFWEVLIMKGHWFGYMLFLYHTVFVLHLVNVYYYIYRFVWAGSPARIPLLILHACPLLVLHECPSCMPLACPWCVPLEFQWLATVDSVLVTFCVVVMSYSDKSNGRKPGIISAPC